MLRWRRLALSANPSAASIEGSFCSSIVATTAMVRLNCWYDCRGGPRGQHPENGTKEPRFSVHKPPKHRPSPCKILTARSTFLCNRCRPKYPPKMPNSHLPPPSIAPRGSQVSPPHPAEPQVPILGLPGLTSSISAFLARTAAERKSMPAGNGVGGVEQSWGCPDTAWEVGKARKGHKGKGLSQTGAPSAGHQPRTGQAVEGAPGLPPFPRVPALPLLPLCPSFSPSLN